MTKKFWQLLINFSSYEGRPPNCSDFSSDTVTSYIINISLKSLRVGVHNYLKIDSQHNQKNARLYTHLTQYSNARIDSISIPAWHH